MSITSAYRLGLYEKALPDEMDIEKKLYETKRFGFDQLEISIDESDWRLTRLDWPDREKQQLKMAIDRTGVPIRTMCLSAHRKYPLGASDPALREQSLKIMRKAISFAAEVGISIIQLAGYDVYYEPSNEETRRYFTENLIKAVQMAAEAGVILGFETMETPFMDTVGKAMGYVQMCDSPWLGVYPDIGNLQNAAVNYASSVTEDLLSGRGHIVAMHLKETRPGVYRDMRFGEGHTDYVACLDCAKDIGVRIFTGEFWHHIGEDYEQEIKRASQFLHTRLNAVFADKKFSSQKDVFLKS